MQRTSFLEVSVICIGACGIFVVAVFCSVHHLLEVTVTLLWLVFEPSPMLIFAGAYVVVGNLAFVFPVVVRLWPLSQAKQKLFCAVPICIIMGAMTVTDIAIGWFLITFWEETLLSHRYACSICAVHARQWCFSLATG